MNIPPPPMLAAMAIVMFFAIGLHEYAHCKFADLAGDPTPRIYGRVTLNLFKHFDPVGTIFIAITMLSGYGLGWGKPAPINPNKMRNPRWDLFVSVAAGPISNLLQAAVYSGLLRLAIQENLIASQGNYSGQSAFLSYLLVLGIFMNVSLFAFNLLPIGPLDGHWLVGTLLPDKLRDKWFFYQRRYGFQVLIGVLLISEMTPINILGRLEHRLIQPIASMFIRAAVGHGVHMAV